MSTADELKALGNKAIAAKNFDEAIEHFTKAIELTPENHILYTNYKKRNFDEAIKHYKAAWELHKDITYLNNLGAAYFEKGDYQECIDICTKAAEEGRERYADFKIIAKSYARIGSAYEKQGDLANAIESVLPRSGRSRRHARPTSTLPRPRRLVRRATRSLRSLTGPARWRRTAR
ncbi:TPR-like protein [Coniochaeta sp. PMI_546]|nr:TPR-like protein [Coniochaeta sp. PMI_546]